MASDAFGNALGASLAGAMGQQAERSQGVGPWSDLDYRNGSDIQSDLAAVQRQTQPYFDQIVGVFSQDGDSQYPGVQIAAGPGFSGLGSDRLRLGTDDLDSQIAGAKAFLDGMDRQGMGAASSAVASSKAAWLAAQAQATSNLYASGAGDVRQTSGAMEAPSSPGNAGGYIDANGEAWATPVTIAEPAGPSFQEANDQKVIAGAYDRFNEIGSALSDGRYGDAWNHFNFTASSAGKVAVNARLFPQPNAEAQRLSTMLASPAGAIAWGVAGLAGASPRTQDAILQSVAAAGQVAGSATGIYKQTLTAQAPMPGAYASARRLGSPSPNDGPSLVPRGQPYAVGPYNEMKGTVPGYDAHHAGQAAAMERMIPGYDRATAPSIVVPREGHTFLGPNGIVSRNTSNIDTPRDLLARDIRELRRVYPDIPNSQLSELVRQNRITYPDAFRK